MPKSKDIFVQEFRSKPFTYAVQVVGVIIVLLNVWLSTKLFPMAQNIGQLVDKVKALETEVQTLQLDNKTDQQMQIDVASIRVSVESIQSRVERIDARLSKHLGI